MLDLWVIQETLWEVKPGLLIECGTNRGGSAFFYAQLFDLIGHGRVLTIDVQRLHDLSHRRIEFLLGSSVSEEVSAKARGAALASPGPVMVILDSDHSSSHVRRELELYAPLVTPGDPEDHRGPPGPHPLPRLPPLPHLGTLTPRTPFEASERRTGS